VSGSKERDLDVGYLNNSEELERFTNSVFASGKADMVGVRFKIR
jgi:hypothetical protein